MKKIILKYTLKNFKTVLQLTQGFRVLSVQLQGEDITVWVEQYEDLIGKSEKKVAVIAYLIGTGTPFISATLNYQGTVQQGEYVWHVYLTL